ncbi:MAG: ATP-binding protein [Gammaproteobacteria bacterium]
MIILGNNIRLIFSLSLFISALFFILLILRMIKDKSAQNLPFMVFFGFLLIPITMILYGITKKDYLLIGCSLFNLLACSTVIGLIPFLKQKTIYSLNGDLSLAKTLVYANQELEDKLAMLDNIIAIMPGYVYWMNKDGVYLGCNDNEAIAVGLKSRKDIVGKRNIDIPGFWVPEKLDPVNKKVMEQGEAILLEEPAVLSDGTRATFLSNKAPLRNSKNEIVGLIGISLNITDRVNAEKREKEAIQAVAEEKIKAEAETNLRNAVTVLAGSIAHDLRVPLTSMSITIDLFTRLLSAFINEYTQLVPQHVDKLHTHIERLESFPIKMKKIINNMNDFISITLKSMRKLVAGTLSQEDFTVCEIEPSVKDVVSVYPYKNQEKELIYIDINYNFEFLGYSVLFYRIIFNLIGNSLEQIEKNKKGEIYITTDQNEKFNLLRYKDTAGGATSEIVSRLFDGYKTTKKSGTGVGLAFCKLTMQSFKGDITCHSVDGDYIEFILSFPKIDKESHE